MTAITEMTTITNTENKIEIGSASHFEHGQPQRSIDDDPHRAAFENNPEKSERLSSASVLAVFVSDPSTANLSLDYKLMATKFLCLSFVAPVGVGFLMVTAIIFQIGTALGDTSTIVWIPGGWTIASSVSFSIAGGLSDIFGRRYVILAGQVFVLVGGVSLHHPVSLDRRLICTF